MWKQVLDCSMCYCGKYLESEIRKKFSNVLRAHEDPLGTRWTMRGSQKLRDHTVGLAKKKTMSSLFASWLLDLNNHKEQELEINFFKNLDEDSWIKSK